MGIKTFKKEKNILKYDDTWFGAQIYIKIQIQIYFYCLIKEKGAFYDLMFRVL